MLAVAVIAVLIVAAGALAAVYLPRLLRGQFGEMREQATGELAARNADVERRLQGLAETLDRRLQEIDQKVDRRLETNSQTTNKIHEKLGEMTRATSEVITRVGELSRLEHALRPPKARGGFGELLLENLLRDRLPPAAYELQYGFSGGERVDAVIRVDKLVPIDSKFPLDNFERMVSAENDDERQTYQKAFARDIKTHVDSIASKYIRPAEGTFEFAFMYLASEAIYYELACGKTGELLAYAHDKRVFPVSGTTLSANLQVIIMGLKSLEIEQNAQAIQANLAAVQREFDRFKADFDLVGKHLSNAQNKFTEADKRLTKVDSSLERASEGAPEIDAPVTQLPRALDAA